jgi:NitT/TauT family transport system ATP-binding protein
MALVVDALEKKFNGSTVFEGLSFSVLPGEFVCLTGPSGCGKTTLLKILAGLIPCSSGKVSQWGAFPLNSADIGFVFQEGALFPWLTVANNVAFGLELRGTQEAVRNSEVKRVLKMMGLTDFSELYPRQLSGGMKLRAALARALVYRPKVLFMDEPLAALDFRTRNKMQRELLDVWTQEKTTILMVTHNIDEAVYLGTRVIVLSDPPAKIKADFAIELPRPRNRTADDFNRIRRTILKLLGENDSIGHP